MSRKIVENLKRPPDSFKESSMVFFEENVFVIYWGSINYCR